MNTVYTVEPLYKDTWNKDTSLNKILSSGSRLEYSPLYM